MNNWTGMGRITKDIDYQTTPNGITVAKFTIAINRDYTNSDGKYDADFIPCVAFKNLADFINNYFSKGKLIAVCGSIQTRTWEKDGDKRYATEAVLNKAEFTGEKSDGGGQAQSQPQQQPSTLGSGFDTVDNDKLPF